MAHTLLLNLTLSHRLLIINDGLRVEKTNFNAENPGEITSDFTGQAQRKIFSHRFTQINADVKNEKKKQEARHWTQINADKEGLRDLRMTNDQ